MEEGEGNGQIKGRGKRRKAQERKAAGSHLLGTGQEGGPGPGKSARLLLHSPPPSLLLSLCPGLRPCVEARNSRRCRQPNPEGNPTGRGDLLSCCEEPAASSEMSFQVSMLQIRKKRKKNLGMHDSGQGGSCAQQKYVGF